MNETTKAKIRLGMLGKRNSLGNKHSEETKQKMRIARAKQIITPEHKKNMSLARLGKKPSKETLLKLSLAHLGHKVSDSTKLKMGLAHLGEKSSLWRGGKSNLNKLRLTRFNWKLISQKARIRDKNTCQTCGLIGVNENLPVHHKIPHRITLNNSLDNLITLCGVCHKKEEIKFEEETVFLRIKGMV